MSETGETTVVTAPFLDASEHAKDADLVERLEVEYSGLSGKILQLLRWGGAIMLELDEYMMRHAEIEAQIAALTGQKPPNTLDGYEKKHIGDAIAQCNGNKSKAARLLGIERRTLLRRVDKYGLAKEVPNKDRKKIELIKMGD